MTAAGAIPYGLLRHQGAMIRATARMLLQAAGRSLLSPLAPRTTDAPPNAPPDAPSLQTHSAAPLQRRIAAPPAQLVEHYIRWCGAAGRYDGQLPPHMVSQWSLPLVSELLMQLPYRLTGIINQGVSMTVHGPLPRATPLMLSAAIEQIAHADGWARIIVVVVTGTAQQARLVETRLHMRVRLPGARTARNTPVRPPDPAWQTVGTWRADASDGLRFSLLTGDFNPIHWCGPLARRSLFGAKVLHGFGSLARSYETLAPGSFRELDVRFLRPVTLSAQALSVQLAQEADADGWRALRLAGGDDMIHLAGRLR
ncbi:MaoC/PaaZ C-terminal domain-containing protein [Duganella sp. S19_KUP01_CR8]|uniref:MaoC/PaaZ C-terminal domain-containing protein n=1 Tax=Duganella sp. S19_KUP01_CR8 TaxID=3025502 RepID=UPI002FCDA315